MERQLNINNKQPMGCEAQLPWKCLFMHNFGFFKNFLQWPGFWCARFTARSVHARLQD